MQTVQASHPTEPQPTRNSKTAPCYCLRILQLPHTVALSLRRVQYCQTEQKGETQLQPLLMFAFVHTVHVSMGTKWIKSDDLKLPELETWTFYQNKQEKI